MNPTEATLSEFGITELSHPKCWHYLWQISNFYNRLDLDGVQTTKLGRLREKLWGVLKNNASSKDAVMYWDSSITKADLKKPRGYNHFTKDIQENCKRNLNTIMAIIDRSEENSFNVIPIKEVEIKNVQLLDTIGNLKVKGESYRIGDSQYNFLSI